MHNSLKTFCLQICPLPHSRCSAKTNRGNSLKKKKKKEKVSIIEKKSRLKGTPSSFGQADDLNYYAQREDFLLIFISFTESATEVINKRVLGDSGSKNTNLASE